MKFSSLTEDIDMEQQKEKKNSKNFTIDGSLKIGSIKVADDVVARIAALAALEVDGVSSMAQDLSSELLGKVGIKYLTKGVRVEIRNKSVKVALALVVEYGYNIPATCQYVQTKVKNAIENMTGLSVVDVNIRIAGVNIAKD